MPDAILVLNAGSSSIKFAVFETSGPDNLQLSCKGLLDEDRDDPRLIIKDPGGRILLEQRRAQFDKANGGLFGDIIDWVEAQGKALVAIGHRVVHGGRRFTSPALISQEVIEALDCFTPLAPLHQPLCLVRSGKSVRRDRNYDKSRVLTPRSIATSRR